MVEILSVKTPNFEMNYAKFGKGKKSLAIIPGLSLKGVLGSAEVVASAFKEYCEEYTIYLLERKQNIGDTYSVFEMARDTAEALLAIGVSRVDIFGASQGGMIAMYMAINYPELVNKIVLASSSSKPEPLQLEVIGNWAKMAFEKRTEDLVNSFIDNVYTEKFANRFRRVLKKMFQTISDEELHRFAVTADACKNNNTYDDLGKIKCPVFVIGAKLDHVLTYEASVKIYKKLKCENVPCEFYTYEEYGHAAFDEAPDYRERMLKFFLS